VPARAQRLPGKALIEFVLRRRLSLELFFARVGALQFPDWRRTGGHPAQRRGRRTRIRLIVSLSSECPQCDQERSSDVREGRLLDWVAM